MPTGLLLETPRSLRAACPFTEDQVRESSSAPSPNTIRKALPRFRMAGSDQRRSRSLPPALHGACPRRPAQRRARIFAASAFRDGQAHPPRLVGTATPHEDRGQHFTDGSIQGFTGALLEDYTRPGYKGARCCGRRKRSTKSSSAPLPQLSGRRAYQRRRRLGIGRPSLKRPWRCPRTDLRHMLIHAQPFPTRSLSA